MRTLLQRFSRNRCGSTALEFAIVAGPLLLLMFGVLEFGRAEWARQTLQEVAMHGARCMGVRQTGCSDAAAAYDAAKTKSYLVSEGAGYGLALKTTDITLDANATCDGVAGFSRVSVTYDFQSSMPGAIEVLVQDLPLVASACFPNQPSS